MQVDAVLERYGPPAATPLPDWMRDARAGIAAAATRFLGIDEADLARRWDWRPGAPGQAEVRYAFYRCLETLERATGAVARELPMDERERPAGSRPFALATAARWDLHGILVSLAEDDLDADPGGGEWTVRQTLAHTVNVQRAYPAWCAWWLTRDLAEELPASAPDEVGEGFPEEMDEGLGSLAEIRERLDVAVDGAAERLAVLDETRLAVPARWSGFAVDVAFRLGRMSSHIQEHTVQVEKTLAMLDREPGEGERLARLVLRAYGRLEAVLFALPPLVVEAGREPFLEAVGEVDDFAEHVRRPGSVTDFDAE